MKKDKVPCPFCQKPCLPGNGLTTHTRLKHPGQTLPEPVKALIDASIGKFVQEEVKNGNNGESSAMFRDGNGKPLEYIDLKFTNGMVLRIEEKLIRKMVMTELVQTPLAD